MQHLGRPDTSNQPPVPRFINPNSNARRRSAGNDPKTPLESCKNKCCERKLRTVVYLLCVIASITQCVYCFEQYLHNSTSVNVKFARNFTLTPPCTTLCPSDFSRRYPAVWIPLLKEEGVNTSYHNIPDLLKSTNMSIHELWNQSRIFAEGLGYTVTETGPVLIPTNINQHTGSSTGIEVQEILTTLGVCQTFCPMQDLTFYGSLSGIQILAIGPVPDSGGAGPAHYKIILHSRDFVPAIRYFAEFFSLTFLFGEHVDYNVRLLKTINTNIWQNPCVSQESHIKCLVNCLDEIIVKTAAVNCRLPYMQGPSHIPMCKTPEEFEEVYNATMKMIYSDFCHQCIRPCTEIEYSQEYFLKQKVDSSKILLSIFIHFTHSKVEVVEESESYSLSSFFSDVGGTLGLFLGTSIFSIYEEAEEFFCNHKKK